jgi:nucleoside-diphosphate-sugar epimerase
MGDVAAQGSPRVVGCLGPAEANPCADGEVQLAPRLAGHAWEESIKVKVALTGAGGVLATEIAAQLAGRKGVQLCLTDMVELSRQHTQEFVRANISVYEEACCAVRDADVVIHCAAIHPWKQYTDDQYLDCNVKGTYHLLKACVDQGVPRVIYTSSIAAVGYDRAPEELPLTEHVTRKPNDLYGATKEMGETFCEMFSRSRGLHVISLRPPCFIPRTGDDYGVGLLTTYGDLRDVAQAHVRALDRGDLRCDAFYCTAPVPYTREDAQELRTDPRAVYVRYFPEARDFILSRPETANPVHVFYDISRARAALGYEPHVDFAKWFARRTAPPGT